MRHVHSRQQLLQIGAVESTLPRFFKHGLAWLWRQSWHDVVARFTGNEDAPHGTGVADTQCRLPTLAFGRWAFIPADAVRLYSEVTVACSGGASMRAKSAREAPNASRE